MVGVVFIGVKGDDRMSVLSGFPLVKQSQVTYKVGGFIAKPRATGAAFFVSIRTGDVGAEVDSEAFSTPIRQRA